VFASLLLLATPGSAQAQVNLSALNTHLQKAVASQNWAEAIQVVDQMMISAPEQANSLRSYRSQLVKLQATGARGPAKGAVPSGSSLALGTAPIKRREHGIPVVDVGMNNRLSFEMMVDSGASITVITRPMAAALGITPAQIIDQIVVSTANGTTTMPIVYVNSISIAGLSSSMVPVAVAGPEMDIGLLGQDFLQRFDVSLRQSVIEFHPQR
jgi:aspartyl protease family protein